METWQKCPVCNGSGNVFGQWNTQAICGTCNGHGIISMMTGFPPVGLKYITGTTTTGDIIFNTPDMQDIPNDHPEDTPRCYKPKL